jgi:GMP synthase-like glutamine amidotransferase
LKVHILQHAQFEGIGSMAPWLDSHRAELSYTRFFENSTLPSLNGLDLIIVMGGPMSVNDDMTFSWLRSEKQFLRGAMELGVPVLGICLGAQLIASALGARVYKNPQKEIGWFPIEGTSNTINTFCFPEKCTVFHWHGETFDLPNGAVRLARSAACENQAFQIGRHVIGLQFHLEMTAESVQSIWDNCGGDLEIGPFIQVESEINAFNQDLISKTNTLLSNLLSYLTHTQG